MDKKPVYKSPEHKGLLQLSENDRVWIMDMARSGMGKSANLDTD